MTGDPIPTRARSASPECPAAPRATRWLGRDPHVPFAMTADGALEEVGRECCATWSRRGARWLSVDAYGQVVGHAEITGGAGYDVTQCFELCLDRVDGDEGIGIYASEGGPWQPPASARWEPDAPARASLETFVGDLGDMFAPRTDDDGVSNDCGTRPVNERTLFFRISARSEGEPDARRYAVVGGRFLVIARYSASDDRWVIVHLDPPRRFTPTHAFMPIGVFDMSGDGVPEVLLHFDGGDGWSDVALTTLDGGSSWGGGATSVGGSTA